MLILGVLKIITSDNKEKEFSKNEILKSNFLMSNMTDKMVNVDYDMETLTAVFDFVSKKDIKNYDFDMIKVCELFVTLQFIDRNCVLNFYKNVLSMIKDKFKWELPEDVEMNIFFKSVLKYILRDFFTLLNQPEEEEEEEFGFFDDEEEVEDTYDENAIKFFLKYIKDYETTYSVSLESDFFYKDENFDSIMDSIKNVNEIKVQVNEKTRNFMKKLKKSDNFMIKKLIMVIDNNFDRNIFNEFLQFKDLRKISIKCENDFIRKEKLVIPEIYIEELEIIYYNGSRIKFQGSESLKSLSLRSCQLEAWPLKDLSEKFPNLEYLHLSSKNYYDDESKERVIEALSGLKKLKVLSVFNFSQLFGSGIEECLQESLNLNECILNKNLRQYSNSIVYEHGEDNQEIIFKVDSEDYKFEFINSADLPLYFDFKIDELKLKSGFPDQGILNRFCSESFISILSIENIYITDSNFIVSIGMLNFLNELKIKNVKFAVGLFSDLMNNFENKLKKLEIINSDVPENEIKEIIKLEYLGKFIVLSQDFDYVFKFVNNFLSHVDDNVLTNLKFVNFSISISHCIELLEKFLNLINLDSICVGENDIDLHLKDQLIEKCGELNVSGRVLGSMVDGNESSRQFVITSS